MRLLILSLDYQHAPLQLRERLAFLDSNLASALLGLYTSSSLLREAAILSTCNRVAIVAASPRPDEAADAIAAFLANWHHLSRSEFEPYLRRHDDAAAARYLLRVAGGLESVVPGEMQILGQVRAAGQAARESGTLGPALAGLFRAAVRAGRRIRHQTAIARRPVSISHAAVALAVERLGGLEGKACLVIGSGKMGNLAAEQLRDAGAVQFVIANRSLEAACALAQRWGGTALTLEDIPEQLARVDVVISCTAAPHTILSSAHVAACLHRRAPAHPLLLIDLAVPRDIDPAVAELSGVHLFDVDGLQTVTQRNLTLRDGERAAAEAIVEEELEAFVAEARSRTVAPTITRLRHTAESIRQAEVDKALRRLGTLDERDREIIEAMSRGIVNKLLHEPTVRLKALAHENNGVQYEQALARLFGLSDEERSGERTA